MKKAQLPAHPGHAARRGRSPASKVTGQRGLCGALDHWHRVSDVR